MNYSALRFNGGPIDGCEGCLPLNLYSLGSSFFGLMLIDEDALDPAWLDFCDASSLVTASDGLTFSSCTGNPLAVGGFLLKGLRKGGMTASVTTSKDAMRRAIDAE